jgi:transposase
MNTRWTFRNGLWTAQDRKHLVGAIRRTRNARQLRRLEAVMLVASGESVTRAATLTGQSRPSVYQALERYHRHRRCDDLLDQPRAGRPRVATGITRGRILQACRANPLTLGYHATTWTVALLADHLTRRHGQRITPRTLRRRMRDSRLRWKRPRYIFKTPDPHKPQKKGALNAA